MVSIIETMNGSSIEEIIGRLSPLSPMATGVRDRIDVPKNLRAVLFDVYGTLLISGIGDIGTTSLSLDADSLKSLFQQSGFLETSAALDHTVPATLERVINRHHRELRQAGADYPEVDIRVIWSEVLELLGYKPDDESRDSLALRYEIKVNPVWPMPGFPAIIQRLAHTPLKLGIVSNAQFYTPILLETLTDSSLAELGFTPEFCSWSYRLRRAKPSPDVFTHPLSALETLGISPQEVLFVGNDMLNDVAAAASVGCRTCLFAGDKRSLRLRETDPRAKLEPDMVITDLSLLECLIDQDG